jgi:hypothetical protein
MSTLDFIEQQKLLYKTLQPCYCKSIQETVHFTGDGLNHLLYKRRRPRNKDEQAYRMALVAHIVEVITDATSAIKTIDAKYGLHTLWILEHEIKKKHKGKRQILKVILQSKKAGNTHFLSVMCRYKQ